MRKYFLLAVFSLMAGICSAYDFSAVSPSGHTLYYNIDGSNVKVTSEIVADLGNDVYEMLPTGDLVIPESVTHDNVTYTVATIGNCAFLNCYGLTSVSIPATVTTIESGALAGCSGIKNLVVPATVTTIESNAFRYVRHVEYSGPATDKSDWNALSLNGVVDGNFAYPDESKTRLNACLDTDADGTVTIPSSVKVIAGYAFVELSSLISIDVPNTVDSIGRGVFDGCENLVSATLPAHISMIDAYLFCDCKSLKSFVVPDSVKKIRTLAFLNCTSLAEVTIGYSAEMIVGNAFRNCTNLKKICSYAPVAPELANGDPFENVPKDEVEVTVPGGSLESYQTNWSCFSHFKEEWNPRYNVFPYADNGQTLYYRLKTDTLTNQTYAICSYPVLFPTTVENVWEGYAKPVGDVVIPGTVEINGQSYPVLDVGRCAFAYCDEMTSVTIPEGVFRMGNSIFYKCTRLQSAKLPSTITEMDTHIFEEDSALVSVNIPEGVTSIPYRTFFNCVSLQSVNIPAGVTSIGNQSFYSCVSLPSITIPEGVTSIGNWAFGHNLSLTEAKLPQSVEKIEDHAFMGCTQLASVTMPDRLDFMGEYCFAYDSLLTSITIPEGISMIEQLTFYKCNRLTSIVIPEGVSGIEYAAFAYCDKLQSVVLPESLDSIGSLVFFKCNALTDITLACTTPPTAHNNTFKVFDATLYVPVGTADSYRQHEVWGKFANIVEGTPTSIDGNGSGGISIYARNGRIVVEGADGECVQVFDMKGQQVPTASYSLPTGIYLVKVGNRPVQKISVVK